MSSKSAKARRPLKPFAHHSSSGYTLPILTGWLEHLANEEEDRLEKTAYNGRVAKRHAKVMEAIQLLNEACDEEYDPL